MHISIRSMSGNIRLDVKLAAELSIYVVRVVLALMALSTNFFTGK